MSSAENFPLTAAERQRLDEANALFLRAPTPEIWRAFAHEASKHVVIDYLHGDLDLREALQIILDISIGCAGAERAALLGAHTFAILREPRPHDRLKGHRRPDFPLALKMSAVNLLNYLLTTPDAVEGNLPKRPNATRRDAKGVPQPCETVPGRAVRMLAALRFFGDRAPPSERTLYEWYLAVRKKSRSR